MLHDPCSPQHFEAEGTGCTAAVGVPQDDDLHVRVLVYVFFAARGCVSCSSCSSKRGVICGTATEGRSGRQDRTLRLVAKMHWSVHAVSGSDPHCFVRVQDQPGSFESTLNALCVTPDNSDTESEDKNCSDPDTSDDDVSTIHLDNDSDDDNNTPRETSAPPYVASANQTATETTQKTSPLPKAPTTNASNAEPNSLMHPHLLWSKSPRRLGSDTYGYGRNPGFWFTLNFPFNYLWEIHRFQAAVNKMNGVDEDLEFLHQKPYGTDAAT